MIALNPRVDCDGLPVKLLNYMATGRAIVSFAGSAEILEHEQTGLVVPSGDTPGVCFGHRQAARRSGSRPAAGHGCTNQSAGVLCLEISGQAA